MSFTQNCLRIGFEEDKNQITSIYLVNSKRSTERHCRKRIFKAQCSEKANFLQVPLQNTLPCRLAVPGRKSEALSSVKLGW